MYRISEDLESGLGGYHVSTAHDAAPEDIEIVIGASADNLESGTNVQDGDSGAHDRRSSWLVSFFFLTDNVHLVNLLLN